MANDWEMADYTIRCTSTGRQCEGYLGSDAKAIAVQRRNNTAHRGPLSLTTKQLELFAAKGPKELRSIELFFIQAAPQLSGYFQEPFWAFVLQVSFDEPAVRHALVAISAVYEQECMPRQPGSSTALKELSLNYYNKAIRSMVKKMNETNRSIVVPVIGCLLFICLELLRNDICSAIRHIDGGINMIEQARKSQETSSKTRIGYSKYEVGLVERVITPVFAFLNVTAVIFGRPGVYFYSRHGEPELASLLISSSMKTVQDALTSLLDLANACSRLLHEVGTRKYTSGTNSGDYLQQCNLMKMLDNWKRRFDRLEKEEDKNRPSEREKKKRVLLKSYYLIIFLWLSTTCSVYETSWDSHKSNFEKLLDLSEQAIGSGCNDDDENNNPSVTGAQSNLFSFELGVIPSLDLVAKKCRYPRLRRRALRMLRNTPKKECFCDSRFVAVLNERLMELEEVGLKQLPDQTLGDDQLPPEEARIHATGFGYTHVPELRGWPVHFLSKPKGPYEDWQIQKELLDPTHDSLRSHEVWPNNGSNVISSAFDLDEFIDKEMSIPMLVPMHQPVLQNAVGDNSIESTPIANTPIWGEA
jgi:hypothetical protein